MGLATEIKNISDFRHQYRILQCHLFDLLAEPRDDGYNLYQLTDKAEEILKTLVGKDKEEMERHIDNLYCLIDHINCIVGQNKFCCSNDRANRDDEGVFLLAPAGFDGIYVVEGGKEDRYISATKQILKSDYMEIELNKGALITISGAGNLHSVYDEQNDFTITFNKQKIICCKNEYNSFIGCVSPKYLKIKENVVFNVMKQSVEFAGNSFLTFDRGVVKGKVAKDVEFTKINKKGKETKLFVPKGRYFDIRKFSLV